jgi:acetyl-CoA synthetase
MVRYSVTMDDTLTEKIDKSCDKRKISRSDWINEACTTHLAMPESGSVSGATLVPQNGACPGHDQPIPTDYDTMYRDFKIDVPEYFNFGFDVVDAWAKKDRNKIAMIWVSQQGVEKKYTFWDLMRLSNQVVNMLIKYGVNKGDRVMIMLPRVPEWWIVTLALIKRGAVYIPAPTMLTAKDIKYRVDAADIKMIVTSEEHAGKVDEVHKD